MTKIKNITGVILAGGQSKRMGSNKALLKLGQKTILEIIYSKMKDVFEEVIISANTLDVTEIVNHQPVMDIYPNHGPLSGIHSSLKASCTQKVFVISCDIPLIETRVITNFVKTSPPNEVVLPIIDGIPKYDFGIYSQSLIASMEEMLNDNNETNPSIKKIVWKVDKSFLQIENLINEGDMSFLNMNTPEDFEKIKLIWNK